MSLFYFRNDRAAIPPIQKDETRALIEERAKKLNPGDPGYAAALVQVVDEVVTDRSQLYRWSTEDTRTLRAELATLAINNLSVYLGRREEMKAQAAQTALSDAKGIMREEDLLFRGFTRVSPDDAKADPQVTLGVIKGLGRLAASLGAPRAADGWYAREITQTVEGERQDNIGQYGKRSRPFMMPFAELRSLFPTDVDNKLLQDVLSTNREGVTDALQGMATALPGGKNADPTKAEKTFLMPSSVLNYTNLLGTQLGTFREDVDRLQVVGTNEHPQLFAVMQENHSNFVHRNYSNVSPELMKTFDKLPPIVQRRNIPGVLGALYGLVQANALVGKVLERGILLRDGSPSEAGNDLQLHLVSSASHARTLEFGQANAVFGGAVADEIGLLLAYRNKAGDRIGAVHDAVEEAVLAAGNEFKLDGKRASAAPQIALDHFGPLMRAIDPSTKLTDEEWTARAKDVLSRARADDVAAICQENFMVGELPKGKALTEALKKEIDSNDYFYKRIDELKGRGKGETALTEEERDVLRNLLYMANATWKVGQVHRAIQDKDLSRVNPSERERVFNPYDMCVTAAGSDLKSFFVVAKDLLVLRG
jgi:hypothetical protein